MDWIIPILVIAAFGAFIYHRKQTKKDGKTISERVGGLFKGNRNVRPK